MNHLQGIALPAIVKSRNSDVLVLHSLPPTHWFAEDLEKSREEMGERIKLPAENVHQVVIGPGMHNTVFQVQAQIAAGKFDGFFIFGTYHCELAERFIELAIRHGLPVINAAEWSSALHIYVKERLDRLVMRY